MSSQKDSFTTVQNGAFSSSSGNDLQGFFIPPHPLVINTRKSFLSVRVSLLETPLHTSEAEGK